MGKSIFVSYKHKDTLVANINGEWKSTARSYVDQLEGTLSSYDHIYKGERDDEDIGDLADSTIGSKLGDKIFASSVTIVLISKGMRNPYEAEKEQWIPWEISYSLREQTRQYGRSKTNAVLAVVLPDENGSYNYYMTYNAECKSTTLHTDRLFDILSDNMFNHKKKDENSSFCNGTKSYHGEHSYILSVKWEDFKSYPDNYINRALEIRKNINEYDLVKNLK
jgi:hypothetical protein